MERLSVHHWLINQNTGSSTLDEHQTSVSQAQKVQSHLKATATLAWTDDVSCNSVATFTLTVLTVLSIYRLCDLFSYIQFPKLHQSLYRNISVSLCNNLV